MVRKANPFQKAGDNHRMIARMIEGRTVRQITKVFGRALDGHTYSTIIEKDHNVVKFKQYLPAGPLPGGGVRQADLIQFWADPGGLRTVKAEDLILL